VSEKAATNKGNCQAKYMHYKNVHPDEKPDDKNCYKRDRLRVPRRGEKVIWRCKHCAKAFIDDGKVHTLTVIRNAKRHHRKTEHPDAPISDFNMELVNKATRYAAKGNQERNRHIMQTVMNKKMGLYGEHDMRLFATVRYYRKKRARGGTTYACTKCRRVGFQGEFIKFACKPSTPGILKRRIAAKKALLRCKRAEADWPLIKKEVDFISGVALSKFSEFGEVGSAASGSTAAATGTRRCQQ
jgi:ribosomal protein L37AE/L43A